MASPGTAAAAPISDGAANDPTTVALPALSDSPTPWTDGKAPATLLQTALALVGAGRRSAPLQAQISAAQVRLDADAVGVRQDRARATRADAAAAVAEGAARAARSRYQALAGLLASHAVQLYMGQGTGSVTTDTGVQSADQLTVAAAYLNDAVGPEGVLEARTTALDQADQAAARAASDQHQAQSRLAEASAGLADEQSIAARLEADLLALDSGGASAVTAAHATLTSEAGRSLTSPSALQFTPSTPLPAPLATTSTALAWAFAELGTPYLWGGTGPEFDCSGLTQYVWRQAGVAIPRVAADQDAWTDPVPLSQLLPGDLVFYGIGYIHHVGIYIGDGLMINAPHTGTSVQVSSIWWSDLAGFGRVHADGTPTASHQIPSASAPSTPVVTGAPAVPSQPGPALPPVKRTTRTRPTNPTTLPATPATAAPTTTVPATTTTTGAPPTTAPAATTTTTVPATTTTTGLLGRL